MLVPYVHADIELKDEKEVGYSVFQILAYIDITIKTKNYQTKCIKHFILILNIYKL